MSEEKILLPGKFEGMSIFRPPLCYELSGKEFTLVMDDGYDRKAVFADRKTLLFGKAEDEPESFACDCLKADRSTYFVNFEVPGLTPRTGITLILDLEQSLVTMVTAHLGQDPKFPRMPAVEFLFGAIRREDGTVPTIRHGYTPDLVGRAIDWNYGTFDVVHVYSSERYYRVAFTPERIRRMVERMKAEG
ncbi:MAG: MoaF N-terminal domain-containing protein, partial [Clostridia bacterium]|nr:MoaF N-terminal domain-containing protein [Clostridia bacterium]